MNASTGRFDSFREFYPYYLSEHSDRTNRRLHYLGSTIAIGFMLTALLTRNPWWLLGSLVSGYACAWIGHFVFEKNRPATFKNPFYSFAGDWVMYGQMLRGKIPF